MYAQNDANQKKALPREAKGNPVYEQTPEDMPLWCCGRNCGRNSRLTVFVLSMIGIACSILLCLSHDYFQFTSMRNDTFYDDGKKQPRPFEYATVAKVGLFWYQIDEVYEYPWPPPRERMLFRDMLQEEVDRLQVNNERKLQSKKKNGRKLQNVAVPTSSTPTASLSPSGVPSGSPKPTTSDAPSGAPSSSNAPTSSAAPSSSFQPSTVPPSAAPSTTSQPTKCTPPLEPGAALDCELGTTSPTMAPTSMPTITNPNDIVAATTQLGVRLKYPNGMEQFDSVFYNAQLGGILGPIFCGCAFLTGLVEYCCCLFKCSWLPTALFLYLAFMFQMFTIFLFLSDDFCKYDHECRLGWAGVGTILATIIYFVCQMLVCCTPRPDPLFNLMKPKPKQKRRGEDDGYRDDYQDDYGDFDNYDDEYYDDDQQYDDDGTYDQSRAQRRDPSYYSGNTGGDRQRGARGAEDQSYYSNDQSYDEGTYYSNDQQGYDDGTYYSNDQQGYDDGTYYSNDQQGYDQGYDNQGYDDGTYYSNDQGYDDQGSRFDQSTYGGQGQSYRTYDDGTGTQYDDGYR